MTTVWQSLSPSAPAVTNSSSFLLFLYSRREEAASAASFLCRKLQKTGKNLWISPVFFMLRHTNHLIAELQQGQFF